MIKFMFVVMKRSFESEVFPHLKSFDFDQLLESVHDEEMTSFVVNGDVSGMKPTFSVKSLQSGLKCYKKINKCNQFCGISYFRIVQVSFHNLRSFHAQFSPLIRAQSFSGGNVNNLNFYKPFIIAFNTFYYTFA